MYAIQRRKGKLCCGPLSLTCGNSNSSFFISRYTLDEANLTKELSESIEGIQRWVDSLKESKKSLTIQCICFYNSRARPLCTRANCNHDRTFGFNLHEVTRGPCEQFWDHVQPKADGSCNIMCSMLLLDVKNCPRRILQDLKYLQAQNELMKNKLARIHAWNSSLTTATESSFVG